jgi:equilibrative nucleoside transporter 1/2/3
MFTFVVTFTLFPGPSFDKRFDDLAVSWSVVIILFFYNLGDTVGKYVADFKGAFNKYSLIFIFFARLIFFIPITAMATGADKDDASMNNYFFPFFNQLLFAITNGFCISNLCNI